MLSVTVYPFEHLGLSMDINSTAEPSDATHTYLLCTQTHTHSGIISLIISPLIFSCFLFVCFPEFWVFFPFLQSQILISFNSVTRLLNRKFGVYISSPSTHTVFPRFLILCFSVISLLQLMNQC